MTLKEIYVDVTHKLVEDFFFYATVKKWVTVFNRDRDRTEDDPQSGRPKTSTTEEQVAIHRIVFDDRRPADS